jgi:hypothetical protein
VRSISCSVWGHELVPWLLERPSRLDAPHRAAIITELREERAAIADAHHAE